MSPQLQTILALLLVALAAAYFVRRAVNKKPGSACAGCSCPKPKL